MENRSLSKGLQFLLKTVMALMCVSAVMLLLTDRASAEEPEITLSVNSGDDISQALRDALKKYNKVIIPAGNYYCSAVKLNARYDRVIVATDAVITQNDTAFPIFYTTGNGTMTNLVIEGGTWDGANVDMPVFRFYGNTDNIVLSNLNIVNFKNAGIRLKDGTNVRLSGVTCSGNAGYGLFLENESNILIENCTFSNCSNGINLSKCGGTIDITGSNMLGNAKNGLMVTDCPNINISNCEIKNNNTGVRMTGISENVSFNTVNANENNTYGLRIYDCTGVINMTSACAYDNGASGFSIENCSNTVTINKSNAMRNKSAGFLISKTSIITLIGCTASDNIGHGINLDGITAPEGKKYCINIKGTESNNNGRAESE